MKFSQSNRFCFAVAAALLGCISMASAQVKNGQAPGNTNPTDALRTGSPVVAGQQSGAPQPGSGKPNMSPPVSTGFGQPAQREPAIVGNTITGIKAFIRCIHDIRLAAQADGLLQELLVEEGASVEQGQIVMTVDERTAMAELAVARKEAEAAAAQAGQDANLRFSRKVAEVSDAEYEEVLELYKRHSASKQETRRKFLEAEKGRLGIEVAEVDHSKDELAAQVAREKVAAAEVQLNLRKVISPYDGIVVERLRDQGEWVKAGEPILRLVHLKEMRVEANVPVKGASVALLQNAQIKLHININGTDWTHDAKVEFVSPVVEMDTCRVWARVPNETVGSAWLLRDGMNATVDLTLVPVTLPTSIKTR